MNEKAATGPANGPTPADPPEHERVYRALRDRVLFGDLRPGQPVTIQGLAAELGAGMTPVREAIRRMTSEGGLVFQGNRRVSVPVLGRSDVQQILFLRCAIEPELTRRACKALSADLLDALRDTDAALDGAIAAGDIAGYLRHNHRFHETLYAAADAPIMAQTVDRLWLQFGPSLRVVCGRFGTQNLPDRHREILAALDQGDAEAAAGAMMRDVTDGMTQVLEVIDEGAEEA
ncbi:GntR family transcriptional regulator [Marinibacterium sp. SX1]|uniref:GntR family transcriptional regulator n=1 Tax=Marinibacterium sp. SX1 TaxID=3388424 RepID=UPI003D166BC0